MVRIAVAGLTSMFWNCFKVGYFTGLFLTFEVLSRLKHFLSLANELLYFERSFDLKHATKSTIAEITKY